MKNKTLITTWFLMIGIILLSSKIGYGMADKNAEIKIKTSVVCSMCKEKIEQGLAFEKGIKDVSVDLETKICTVKYNSAKTTPGEIREAISKLGYDADDVAADEKAYEKLPACCKKDVAKH